MHSLSLSLSSSQSPDSSLSRRHSSIDQLYRNNSYDPKLFNVKQVPPEQIAVSEQFHTHCVFNSFVVVLQNAQFKAICFNLAP